MTKFMMIILAIFMASCCTTKEFIATENTEASENYERYKHETSTWYEYEKEEFEPKVPAFMARIKTHGEVHGVRFMKTLNNFLSRESEKFASIGDCN